jgi:thiol-disulfide isomerase/thioredoxin
MKIKLITALWLAAVLFALPGKAQNAGTASATDPALQTLVGQITDKLKAGKNTEADLADELKQFDTIIAAHKSDATPDIEAKAIYMKAMLYFQVFDDKDQGSALLTQLKTDYPGTKYGMSASNLLVRVQEQSAQQSAAEKIQAGLAKGVDFPDFSEQDLNGKPISVGALKGKVVMVDFWATWCGPCRGELPNVIATYKKHHTQGFEIIGVSLDSDRDKLDAFLKQQDGMTWPQFFDGQGWSNKLAVKYGVESIPFAVLIGPDGKIIGKDLRGEELENAVAAALAKQ